MTCDAVVTSSLPTERSPNVTLLVLIRAVLHTTGYQDIRLVGGQSENEGRVEVLANRRWGTVCDDDWDLDDAIVVCKELGYPGAEAYFTNSYFGGGSGTIWLDNVECSGEENSLNDCTKNIMGNHNCVHAEDAGVTCTARDSTTEAMLGYQDVRLIGGQSENEGRVEVLVNGEWGTVCDDVWGFRDAIVVCIELGYPGADAYFTNSHFGGGSGAIWLDNVDCSGGEYSLNDCPKNRIGDHNCGHDEDAGVECIARDAVPGYQDIRLIGGQSENVGRVEVLVNGEWGTVCDDVWDLQDAIVVCKELGYLGAEAYFTNSYFGGGSGSIWLDNVDCSGKEKSLNNCTKNIIGDHNCGHDEDAGVTCTARDSITEAMSGVGTEQPSTSSNCEPLRSSLCRGMPYNLTSLPSGITTQKEAEQILSLTFQLVIPLGCPAGFFQFMCLQSMPPCDSTGIPIIPCKELCETGIKDCYATIEASGVPIPPLDLDCSLFPAEETGLCFAEDPSGLPYEDKETDCEQITVPLCMDLPYNSTRLPNILGHDNQLDAGLEVHQFFPLVQVECSPYLKEFLCSVYTPPCYVDTPDPPCKELCLAVKEGCIDLMTTFGFAWPESLDCDQFPSVTFGTLCYAGQIVVSSADQGQDYRDDYRCGGDYLAPNGEVARCKKDSEYPCCSADKWCGITSDHCECPGCIDYRYHD
ncbi:Neurotrypsin [Holothuria leucospilota]|uniref:Neurotrypsin n=1 Tax=Holothuria leucospilota TaxID=206669 RepID=A0A9Q1HCH0_HOLLE|nr:Neurotrypsin [Holothuria leucospilota]